MAAFMTLILAHRFGELASTRSGRRLGEADVRKFEGKRHQVNLFVSPPARRSSVITKRTIRASRRRPVEMPPASPSVFESYKPPSFAKLPARFRQADGQWWRSTTRSSSDRQVLRAARRPPVERSPRPAVQNMLQMADARTSRHRGHADLRSSRSTAATGKVRLKELRPNVQLYTKSGGGGTPPWMGQVGGGIFIVDALDTKAKGYEVTISFPKEGIGTAAEGIALIKGAKNPEAAKKLIDWSTSPAMQNQFAKYKINFVPAHPDVALEPSLAAVLKDAKIFPIDADYAGANRKRIVERWVAEILNP
jgi:iron(III) transport system substrate-binding protein